MSVGELLHVLFYFSGIISIMIGSYSLYIDSKSKLNRTFFALCISLSVWAIGFSMAIDAANLGTCVFWRRISALGWGSMYSIFLHCCLVLTKKDISLKKWWIYLLVYSPAAITIFVFAISNNRALQQYNIVMTPFGWTNILMNNEFDYFFYLYYLGYMLCGLGIVWHWARHSYSQQIKKQSKLILTSSLIAFLLGTATDIICSSVYSIKILQIAPIINLIPIITIYYSITRYGLMNPEQANETEVILNESARAKVYVNLSITLLVGGVANFIVQYFSYMNFIRSIYSSIFILLIGITIYILKIIKFDYYIKDFLLMVVIFLAIPSITLIFIKFGSVTIWSISFLFIVIALLFNRLIVLTVIAISILSTQVLVWTLKPVANLTIDKVDYIGRIGILCITIWLAFYVSKIYIKRLRQNADQLALQRFISEISSDFINVNQSNIDEKMKWVIRILGKLFSIDQINILLFDLEHYTIDLKNIWDIEAKSASGNQLHKASKEDISWLINNLISYDSIYIPDVDILPETAAGMKNELKRRQISSFVEIPIAENEKSIRILEFASVNSAKEWTDEELRVLKIIANIFADALLKVEAENEISYMAYHDHLTGLANRRLFNDRLNEAIEIAKRTEKMIGLIFIDLDSFKTINDTLGHKGGDSLLRVVSEKLVSAVSESDTVCRFGGDEFLIMINNLSNEKEIINIVEKIMSILNQPLCVEGQEFNMTSCAGISMYPFDGTETDSLIKNADFAIYKAKEKGKNQYVICSSELRDEVIYKNKIINSLHRALEQEEFYLNYQPQVNLPSGEIIGLEALMRWNHPELGFVSPAVFIPIAEQTGVINEIGEWVLKTACEQNKKWQTDGYSPVRMAVNVSVNQLRNQNFALQIRKILKETALEPRFLEVEITESAAMNETNDIVKFLNDIRNLGIMISIDDFGTDYSSLSRLDELPIDKIKIDKRFIDNIEKGEKGKAIVRTIINLSQHLKVKVIAEGVENEEQLEFLKQELCDEVQGYYYYKPMPSQEIEKILGKNNV